MKIEKLISGKGEREGVDLEGTMIPVAVLRKLSEEGYTDLRVYSENHTFFLWGKTCSACFTSEQLQKRAQSK